MSYCKWLLEYIPALGVIALMIWSYYAYVCIFCEKVIPKNETARKIAYLFFFHIFFLLQIWAYLKVMCTGIATVPYEFKVPNDLYDTVKFTEKYDDKSNILLEFCNKRNLTVVTRNEYGHIRFCNKCKHIKPDRSHHCSTCGTCVLKMDHHCPWVHNCIGFSNYKAFILYLWYTTFCCCFISATTLEFFIKFLYQPSYKSYDIQILIEFVTASGLGTVLFSFTCFHMSMIAKNETTLESLREPVFKDGTENLTFDIGVLSNFGEVFGDDCYLWFIPQGDSKGDGVNYPTQIMA